MALRETPVDVVLVGFGWTGAIMAQQLADAGLQVLALERGAVRQTADNFATTFDPDELRYVSHQALLQNSAESTLTFRNSTDERALPIRRFGAFLPGTGVGGAGVHWNGQIWRFLPTDFTARSHLEARYGKAALDGLTIQDYPVTYDQLEPYYTMFDHVIGTTGQAGNLKGEKRPDGNPFEGPRSEDFPNPPMSMTYGPTLFADAARRLGHQPFPQPGGNMSRPWTTISGRNSASAPTAASASSSAAATIPNPRRRRPLFPMSCRSPTSSCAQGAKCCGWSAPQTAAPPPA